MNRLPSLAALSIAAWIPAVSSRCRVLGDFANARAIEAALRVIAESNCLRDFMLVFLGGVEEA
jgi:hypothetical protein